MSESAETAETLLAQEMMTLAGLAYGQPADLSTYLADTKLATKGRWDLKWLPVDAFAPENFAFLAKDGDGKRYALAIRGTYPNPLNPAYWEDAGQDNPFGTMVDWPYPAESGALVSKGIWAGFLGVTGLASDDGSTLVGALEALPSGSTLFVTGHSLGGTLAPVVGQWAKGLASKPNVRVLSFAGMTPGNTAFADLIGAATDRFYNDLDSVPYGWNAVLETKDFYQPSPQGGALYQAAIEHMASDLAAYPFAPVGRTHRLPGDLRKHRFDIPFVTFLLENLYQHLPDTYLDLLGAPELPFKIGFGAAVAPKTHPAASSATHAMPVSFFKPDQEAG